ncbi:MAG: hypothetical protein LBD24_08695 [Spirochaetaceae bacterium]|jgi:hypothetical protein|nr:hypothetical protein [Spirochaetaceae bacterium]
MTDLTEEEYDALDEKWTKDPPEPGPNGTGFFARRTADAAAQSARSITVDSFTADYLLTRAIAACKTPSEIIREPVREKIAASL